MQIETFRDRCRARFSAAVADRRAEGFAPIAPDTLRDLAEAAAGTEAAALGDGDLPGLAAALLDRIAGGSEEPLRDVIRGAAVQDALLRLEPDLDAALLAGQGSSTLADAVSGAIAALDRAVADRRAGFANRDAVADILADVGGFDTPLYGVLCAKVASTLRDAGDPAPAEALLAAHEARGAVLSRPAGARP